MIAQPVHHHSVWAFYVVGFIGSLLYKWGQYVYQGKKKGTSIKDSTLEWFFEPSLSNFFSWTATIGGVWVMGSIYINRIVDVAALSNVPVNNSIGFLLGSLFEFIFPNILKWITSFIPGNK